MTNWTGVLSSEFLFNSGSLNSSHSNQEVKCQRPSISTSAFFYLSKRTLKTHDPVSLKFAKNALTPLTVCTHITVFACKSVSACSQILTHRLSSAWLGFVLVQYSSGVNKPL